MTTPRGRKSAQKPAQAPPATEADQNPPPNENAAEELVEGQEWTTLAELGDKVPLAVGDRSFTFKPQNLANARKRGAVVPKALKNHPAAAAAHNLAASLDTLFGAKCDDHAATVAKLTSTPWPSVLYMLLRVAYGRMSNGTYTVKDIDCPSCGKTQTGRFDLGAMKVRDWGQLEEPPQMDVDLEVGFEWPPGKEVKMVVLEPAPWASLADLSTDEIGVEAEVTASFLSRAIVAVDTTKGRSSPTIQALGSLVPADYNYLDESHVLLCGGPTKMAEAECSRCEKPIYHLVNWTRADFLAGSSPARRRRRRRRSK